MPRVEEEQHDERTPKNLPDFGEGWTIEEEGILFDVKRVHFKRIKKFKLSDHMFVTTCKTTDGSDPLLIDILNVLERGVASVITWLQKFYAPNRDFNQISHIYGVVESHEFDQGAIMTGNYLLHPEDVAEDQLHARSMAARILQMVAGVLQSKKEMRMDSDISFRFTVINVKHLEYKGASMRTPNTVLGMGTEANGSDNADGSDDGDGESNERDFQEARVQGPDVGINAHGKKLPVSAASPYLIPIPELQKYPLNCLISATIVAVQHKTVHRMRLKKEPGLENARKVLARYAAFGETTRLGPLEATPHRRRLAQQGATALQRNLKHLIARWKLSKAGPRTLEKIGPLLCRYFNIQMHVYDQGGTRLYYSCPRIYERGRAQVFFLKSETDDTEVAHVDVILDLEKYMRQQGAFPCFKCRRPIQSIMRHKCRNPASPDCQSCLRERVCSVEEKNFIYLDSQNVAKFCWPDPHWSSQRARKKCTKCHAWAASEQCWKLHKKHFCGSRGEFCQKCSRAFFDRNASETGFPRHVCHESYCRLCYTAYLKENGHFCKFKPVKGNDPCGLIFYDIECIYEPDQNTCMKCFHRELHHLQKVNTSRGLLSEEERLDLRCDEHRDDPFFPTQTYHRANLVSVLYEGERHGYFHLISFASPEMNHKDDCRIFKNYYISSKESYYMPALFGKKIDRVKPGKGRKRGLSSSQNRFPKVHTQPPSALDAKRNLSFGYNKKFTKRQLEDLKHYEPLDKMLLFFLRKRFHNSTLVAHNAGRYDSVLIAECLYNNGLSPNLLTSGCKILCMKIGGLTFLDSMNYVGGSLRNAATRYDLDIAKGTFPLRMNRPCHYNFGPEIPPFTSFINDTDNDNIIKEKRVWYEEAQTKPWHFQTELVRYCVLDVEVLAQILLKFLKEVLRTQTEMCAYFATNKTYIFPLSEPIITVNSLVYRLYLLHEGHRYDFRITGDDRGETSIATSYYEREFCLERYRSLGSPSSFESFYTSNKLPRIGSRMQFTPDYVYWENKESGIIEELGFMNGCEVHGHLSKSCTLMPKGVTEHSLNYRKERLGSLNAAFARQLSDIRHKYTVKKVNLMWQCQWDKEKGAIKEREKMLLTRLIPKEGLRGGRVEGYCLAWDEKIDGKSANLHYLDINSMYPAICQNKDYAFPLGPPEIIVSPLCLENEVKIERNELYLRGQSVAGFVKVKVVPSRIMLPFLPMRFEGKSILGCCKKCIEKRLNRVCTHSDEERALIETYTVHELAFAVSTLGYRVLTLYELYAYKETDRMFEKFVNFIAAKKIRYSGYPSEVQTETEKTKWRNRVNREMNFEGDPHLELTESNVCNDPVRRQEAKLFLNVLLGKLSQEQLKEQTLILNSQTDLERLYNDPKAEISEIFPLGDSVVHVKVKPRAAYHPPGDRMSLVAGAYVTACCRIQLYKDFLKIQDAGGIIFYSDTDSVIFSLPKTQAIPLKLDDVVLGAYKFEYKNIVSFLCLGSKNYMIKYKVSAEPNASAKTVFKVRGFYLQTHAKSAMSETLYREFVNELIRKGKQLQKMLPQFSIRIDKKKSKLFSSMCARRFSNHIYTKRVLIKNLKYSLPFGYTPELLKKAEEWSGCKIDETMSLPTLKKREEKRGEKRKKLNILRRDRRLLKTKKIQ